MNPCRPCSGEGCSKEAGKRETREDVGKISVVSVMRDIDRESRCRVGAVRHPVDLCRGALAPGPQNGRARRATELCSRQEGRDTAAEEL